MERRLNAAGGSWDVSDAADLPISIDNTTLTFSGPASFWQYSGGTKSYLQPQVRGTPRRQSCPQYAPAAVLPVEDSARKALPIFTFLCEYFPNAIIALTELCVAGNKQHNPDLPPTAIKWAREKSTDQLNTAFRHMLDYGTGTAKDADGQWHLAKAAWRCLAQLQLDIENSK